MWVAQPIGIVQLTKEFWYCYSQHRITSAPIAAEPLLLAAYEPLKSIMTGGVRKPRVLIAV